MITIREVSNRNDLLKFIKFPFRLYKNNPYWVPPIIKDELRSFSNNNPVFEKVKAVFYLAYKNNKVVGRVVGIINKTEITQQQKLKVRFGWIDFIDDERVSKALLDKVIEFGKQHNLKYIEGPVGFTGMDKAGMLTFGFDQIATMIGLYNYDYYPKHLENLGFRTQAEWREYKFNTSEAKIENSVRFSSLIEKRYNISALHFKTTKEIMPYTDQMFDLLNLTYRDLQSFVPLENFQIEHYKKKFIPLLNPEFILCIIENNTKKLIGFAITIPSLSKAFQKANGRLFPFGFLHIIKALKSSKSVEFYLIGIHPEYQSKGVTSIIFTEFEKIYKKHRIEWAETNPQLEENKKIHALWKSMSPKIHKRRKTFRLDF